MKTHVYLVSGPVPEQRAQAIERLLLKQASSKKITVMASTEVFLNAPAQLQAELLALDQARKARGIHVLRLSAGCPCCSLKLVLTTHLARTLRLNQPHVLLIELATQSHPGQVIKILKEPEWNDWFSDITTVAEICDVHDD